MPAHAEAAGDADPVDAGQRPLGALGRRAGVRGHPADLHLRVVRDAAGAQRLGDRQVGVGQVDVLADQGEGHLVAGPVHRVGHLVPGGPVDVPERQVEPAHDVGVQTLAVQHARDVVDARRVGGRDDRLDVDVGEQRDLALGGLGHVAVAAQHQGVGLDTDRAQRGDRVLRRLGLELPARPDVGHQRHVQEEDVVPAHVVADLAGRLEERLGLDVADRAADLGDDHVDVVPGLGAHPGLDLVGDVRDDLHRVAEVLPAPLLGDHRRSRSGRW